MAYEKPQLFVLKSAGAAVSSINDANGSGSSDSKGITFGEVHDWSSRNFPHVTSSSSAAYEADE